MKKAILMDFNGVIIDDEGVQLQVYRGLLADKGVEMTDQDYFDSLGMDDRTFVSAAFERKGKAADEATVDRIVDAKFGKWKDIVGERLPLFEGIEGFIEKMAREFTLGLVSMASRSEIDFVLDKSGMAKHFSTIVTAEDVEKCKPDPEVFRIGFRKIDAARTAQGHLPMTHGECLVIEDSPPGIVGARLADLPALGVTNTVTADKLRAAGAAAVATDLRDWMPESIRRVFI